MLLVDHGHAESFELHAVFDTACVPTRISTVPAASASSTCERRLPFTMP
jgi:hypothetical protein